MSTYINWYSQSFFDRIPENTTLCITQTLSFSFNRDVHFLYFFFCQKGESAVLQGENKAEDSSGFKEQDDGSAVEDTLAEDGEKSQSNTGKGASLN